MQIERHGQIVRGRGPNSGCTQLSEVACFNRVASTWVRIGGGEDCAVGAAEDGSKALGLNQRAEDLMMGAPSDVSPRQLRELHIRVVKPG